MKEQILWKFWEICPGLTLVRCTRISISVTKCPFALLPNFNITRFLEYRQLMSQSVPQIRVRQIFFTKLVPGQVACKSHLPRRMRWLSHVTDGTSAAEIILHHLVVINKDI